MPSVNGGAFRMSTVELRAAASLSAIYLLRMFGLFLIVPVFSLYATRLAGATPLLTGLALGAYGLTQALFQIPFGSLSDRLGRKPVIAAGLVVFAIGSATAALSHHILGVILGRGLQGVGAISAAVMALAADLTREEQRTKVMACIGITIGLAFTGALVMGPVLDARVGLQGLFWISVLLALAALAVLFLAVPDPEQSTFHRECEPQLSHLRAILAHPGLLRLDAGIMLLHMSFTASFVALPIALRSDAGLASADHWQVYLPALLISLLVMAPFLRLADRGTQGKAIFLGAIGLLGCAELGLFFVHNGYAPLLLLVALFFSGFNFLEAHLPALVSRVAPADRRGTALGIYAMSQFLGTFIGGALGGWLLGKLGIAGVFAFCTMITALWFLIASRTRLPRHLSNHMIKVGQLSGTEAGTLAGKLCGLAGVAEAVVVCEDGIAYLKIDRDRLDWDALRALLPARE